MIRGKRAGNFMPTHAVTFFLAAVFIVFLLGLIDIGPFSPQAAQASTKSAVDELFVTALDAEDGGPTRVAYAYVNDGSVVVSFDSGKRSSGSFVRPQGANGCGSLSNSCICACRDDKCDGVLKCKGFPGSSIERIIDQDGSYYYVEGPAQLNAELSLQNRVLRIENVG